MTPSLHDFLPHPLILISLLQTLFRTAIASNPRVGWHRCAVHGCINQQARREPREATIAIIGKTAERPMSAADADVDAEGTIERRVMIVHREQLVCVAHGGIGVSI